MPGSLVQLVWGSLKLFVDAVLGIFRVGHAGVQQSQRRHAARIARGGLIGPDDPPPPPELAAGVLDYRGLARPQELKLAAWAYRLGHVRYPGGGWQLIPGEIGLAPQDITRHAVVIGPPQSGKTSSIVVPWIYRALAMGNSVVAVDGHGQLWQELKQYGASQGKLEVRVFHWDYKNPRASSSWRWVDELDGEEAVEAAAAAILGAERQDHEHRRDMRYLMGLLTLARGLPQPLGTMLDALADQRRLKQLLAQHSGRSAARDLRELLVLAPDQFPGAVSRIVDGLRPLATSEVLRVTEQPGFKLQLLIESPTLLIVGSPATATQTAQATLSLILALAGERCGRSLLDRGAPTVLMLDDAPRVQGRVRLAGLLAQGARSGLAMTLTANSVSQFSEEHRDAILANCATMIMLSGADRRSTDYFAERLGQRAAAEVSTSAQRGAPWEPMQHGQSVSSQPVAMLGHRELSMLPFDGHPAIVHARTISPKPILVDLTREDL